MPNQDELYRMRIEMEQLTDRMNHSIDRMREINNKLTALLKQQQNIHIHIHIHTERTNDGSC